MGTRKQSQKSAETKHTEQHEHQTKEDEIEVAKLS
jgi:hypothetical protein